MLQVVRLYVCPNCDNYVGYTDIGHLEREQNVAHGGGGPRPRGMRSRCPACGENRVERWAKLIPPDEVAEVRREVERKLRTGEMSLIS